MTALLEVRDISVSFGGLQAVNHVSIDVAEGTIVGLIGPNGAGKTTTFNVISGLQAATGQVILDGRDITGLPPHRRALLGMGRSFQNLGLMPQESVLTNMVAAQHVTSQYRGWDLMLRTQRWWREESAMLGNARSVLAELGLDGYENELVEDLSFGVARFVELAAVLASRPRLMLLDEPTTGLDVSETDRLIQLLVDLRAEGTTVLVVAHDVRFVMAVCDDVYVLAGGCNLAHGVPEEIQRDPAVIDVYLGKAA